MTATVGPAPIARASATLQAAAAITMLALAADPAADVWHVPQTARELLTLSTPGAVLAGVLYLVVAGACLLRTARALTLPAAAALIAVPFLFNFLLLLASPLPATWLGSLHLAPAAAGPAANALVLFLFNEAALLATGYLLDRRGPVSVRVHLLLAAAAVGAALTPLAAQCSADSSLAGMARLPAVLIALLLIVIAQAGLWGQTYLVTGLLLDGLRRRRPTSLSTSTHWRAGVARGAIYGGVFVAIVQGVAAIPDFQAIETWMRANPLASAIAAGALFFPLAKTLVESFDGSAPFFRRLASAHREPINYLRGGAAGAGLGLIIASELTAAPSATRFVAGFATGALAYGGVDWLWDLGATLAGRRQRLQSWRIYLFGAALGGVVAGALAWYCDAAQLLAVTQKFQAYAALSYANAHLPEYEYVVYPLFSKWGAIKLADIAGGAQLFFSESLSGVINWSLAAPLFSINLVLLTALFRRSFRPLENLLSAQGVADLAEQAIRVLRWGLWMAPVIYSFLRLAPDPTWYNQDGAVRSAVAILQSWRLTPEQFAMWSLEAFLGLLAYDWLRMLIWFDHMGVRVATLVNLSFVGGDWLDERCARLLGFSARTRCIPEGIRRFLTWAPLLIPFYIPRGKDWDFVWSQSQAMQGSSAPLLPAVGSLMFGYELAALGIAALVVALIALYRRQVAGAVPRSREKPFTLSNGQYGLELWPDGRGYSHVTSGVRRGYELDVTRRPDDPLQLRGKFFYFREGDALWSLTAEPCRVTSADYCIRAASASQLGIVNEHGGIRAEAVVSVHPGEPVEFWRIRLTNREPRARRVEVTSYQEFALSGVEAYRRSPPFTAIHTGTWFVRSLNAILCRNRLLRDASDDPKTQRMSREIAFHAASTSDAVRLVGYEDSRAHFLGQSTARHPAVFSESLMRGVTDEGLLYGFDPAASLRLEVDLPANGSVECCFVDGYAGTEQIAAQRIARHLPGIKADAAEAAFSAVRTTHEAADPGFDTAPFAFSSDGRALQLHGNLPRPWCHVLANPAGHGAIVSSDGEIFSFAANSQQNALSPFHIDTVPAQLPGQAIYVTDLATGAVDTATPTPCRTDGPMGETTFGRGFATFTKVRGALDMTLDVFTLPDEPVEVRVLRLRNRGSTALRLRVAPYLEMVLAEVHADSAGALQVESDAGQGVLFFANPQNDFHKGWAFVATSLESPAMETVRSRFAGAARDVARPHFAVHGCADKAQPDDGHRIAAFAGELEIAPQDERDVAVVIGQSHDRAAAAELIRRYRIPASARQALDDTKRWWDTQLSMLRVETNLPEFDRLVNDWLPYQVLASRLWARSGPSQRSGAFGFRDQLQDVLPLLFTHPQLARRQILLHAGFQFREGDVLKWAHHSWEDRIGIGVRTRASDPHLWLPYVVARYVAATGDSAILDESIPFIEGDPVPRGREGYLLALRMSRDAGSLYEHCRRAVDLTLRSLGPHGIPLMGSGDWNDGLNAIAISGRGESTWLGFFLHDVLRDLAAIVEQRGEDAARYREAGGRLRGSLDRFWRGDRYVRATSDEGEELLSCSALMAAWPLLSGAVDLERGLTALESALRLLEKEDRVLLCTPPFTENSRPYPGYLADYPPGVRENGGQYSHGASWTVDAYLRAAALASQAGRVELAARCRARAFELWRKISPLSKTSAGKLRLYGLPPHQQPADVYDGPGYAGRGGWSWYTGAAARMLSAAYTMLGLSMRNGELHLDEHALAHSGPLVLRRVSFRGKTVSHSA